MKNIFLFLVLALSNECLSQTYPPVSDTIQANSWSEAMEITFGLLPKSHYPSGYLLNKSTFLSKFESANGTENDSSFNMLEWYFLQNIIRSSYYRPDSIIGYVILDSIKNKYIRENNVLPWGIIDITADYISDSAFINGYVSVSDHRLIENNSNHAWIYKSRKLFCVTPLNIEVFTFNPQFIIKPEYVVSNNTQQITKIEIDLDDGIGLREIEFNIPFQASYYEGGYKTFLTRFIYNNNDTLYSRSELNVIDQGELERSSSFTPRKYDDLYSIYQGQSHTFGDYPDEFLHNANLSQNLQREDGGAVSFAEVGVWYGCGNTSKKIRKPLVIFAGYNPKNGKALSSNTFPPWYNDALGAVIALPGWRGPLYETYNGFFTDASKNAPSQAYGSNGNNLLDKVSAEGYDILIVRMHEGIGYLQNTAWLGTLVLKEINKNILNETYGVTNPGADIDPEAPGYPNTTTLKKAKHELIVAGYSAGALSSRMGLLLMEYEHLKDKCEPRNTVHRTKTWIAMDCENQGSNTPIGEQMFMDFQASIWASPANMGDVANSLICKSARDLMGVNGVATQNTLYHLGNMYYAGNSNWNVGHHSDFDGYFQDLVKITPTSYPANIKGYPKNCYRIGVSQGSANGIGQLISSDIKLVENESPTFWCASPAGTSFGVVALGAQTTPYRLAKGRVITSWNDNAFTCKYGASIKTLVFSWHVNLGHWKYHDNNHIIDANFGGHRNYDEAPASSLTSHLILGKKLPLSTSNAFLNAFGQCNYVDYNHNLHGFSPTVSGIDLHLPGQNSLPRYPDLSLIPGNVSGGMNLMQQNNYGLSIPGIQNNSPNSDFGFPHLIYPTNHYDYSPYDAIWANTTNNNNYDHNTIHVEDPNPLSGEFLSDEIAPKTLYLSDRIIQGEQYTCSNGLIKEKYYSDFEARNSVLAGNQSIYSHNQSSPYPRVRTAQGDFVIADGAVVTMRANNSDGVSSVILGAGFSAKHGSIFRAYVYSDANMCAPFSYNNTRSVNVNNEKATFPEKEKRPILSKRVFSQSQEKNFEGIPIISIYPNPTNGSIYYSINRTYDFKYYIRDVTGRVLETGVINKSEAKIDLNRYKAGVYFITITSNMINQTDRIILQ